MMEDTTATTTNQSSGTPAPKQQIFGGNQEAFANLEKFEQISNPTLDQDFNFDLDENFTAPLEENRENTEKPESITPSALDVENIFESVAKSEPIQASESEIQAPEVKLETISEPEIAPELSMPEVSTPELSMPEVSVIPEIPEIKEPSAPEPQIAPKQQTIQTSEKTDLIDQFNENNENENKKAEEIQIQAEDNIPTTVSTPKSKPAQEATFHKEEQKSAPLEQKKAESSTAPTEPKFNAQKQEQRSAVIKPEKSEVSPEVTAHQKLEFEPSPEATNIIKKYFDLLNHVTKILATQEQLTNKKSDEFSTSTPTENETITYTISLKETSPTLDIHKIIQKPDHEAESHTLNFSLKSPKKNLVVTIDDFRLYEEETDLTDAARALNVTNKFSKFEFLFREELSKLEEELGEKEKKKQNKIFATIFHQF